MSDAFNVYLLKTPHRLKDVPEGHVKVGQAAVDMMTRPIVAGSVLGPLLLTFHGVEVRQWHLSGELPAPLDDVLRGLSSQLHSDALSFVVPVPAPTGIGADHAFHLVSEAPDGAHTIGLYIRGTLGDRRAMWRVGSVGEARRAPRWLGVPTTWRFQLRAQSGGFSGTTTGEA